MNMHKPLTQGWISDIFRINMNIGDREWGSESQRAQSIGAPRLAHRVPPRVRRNPWVGSR